MGNKLTFALAASFFAILVLAVAFESLRNVFTGIFRAIHEFIPLINRLSFDHFMVGLLVILFILAYFDYIKFKIIFD